MELTWWVLIITRPGIHFVRNGVTRDTSSRDMKRHPNNHSTSLSRYLRRVSDI